MKNCGDNGDDMSDEYDEEEDYYDPFDSPGIRWTQEHGDDPDKWPLPPGQPMTWAAWARALSAEAMRQGFQPKGRRDFFPWSEEDIKWAAGTCWVEGWITGKTPAQEVAAQNKPSGPSELVAFRRPALFDSPGMRWTQAHGDDPDMWPQPIGQRLPWKKWAAELEARARRRGWDMVFFADMTWWADYWIEGKTPAQAEVELMNTEVAC
ncbi:MAG: hypothetical protein EOM66_05990 [Clostridia bacterium]|nr:hypothetical protein [Clostridia bacterium]